MQPPVVVPAKAPLTTDDVTRPEGANVIATDATPGLSAGQPAAAPAAFRSDALAADALNSLPAGGGVTGVVSVGAGVVFVADVVVAGALVVPAGAPEVVPAGGFHAVGAPPVSVLLDAGLSFVSVVLLVAGAWGALDSGGGVFTFTCGDAVRGASPVPIVAVVAPPEPSGSAVRPRQIMSAASARAITGSSSHGAYDRAFAESARAVAGLSAAEVAARGAVPSATGASMREGGGVDIPRLGSAERSAGTIFAVGSSGAMGLTTTSLPVTCGAFDEAFDGPFEGLILALSPRGNGLDDLHYLSHFGGTNATGGNFLLGLTLEPSTGTPRLTVVGGSDATDVPGTKALAANKDKVSFTYRETPNGGRVDIVTTDAATLKAAHDFMRFQIADHKTGDSGQVTRR